MKTKNRYRTYKIAGPHKAAPGYELKLQRAKKEAEGKATANRIINSSLTDKILQEKGTEATLKLAGSPNAKTVIIGSNRDSLPVILENQ